MRQNLIISGGMGCKKAVAVCVWVVINCKLTNKYLAAYLIYQYTNTIISIYQSSYTNSIHRWSKKKSCHMLVAQPNEYCRKFTIVYQELEAQVFDQLWCNFISPILSKSPNSDNTFHFTSYQYRSFGGNFYNMADLFVLFVQF